MPAPPAAADMLSFTLVVLAAAGDTRHTRPRISLFEGTTGGMREGGGLRALRERADFGNLAATCAASAMLPRSQTDMDIGP